MVRKGWEIPFLADAKEVAALRRIVRLHLAHWGLVEVAEAAELCVSELVANVITHVGENTPMTFAITMNGTYVRIEVGDSGTRTLPTLIAADESAEGGRGIALVAAVAHRWGVTLHGESKVTWCELETGLATSTGHTGGRRVDRAEALIGFYGEASLTGRAPHSRLTVAVAEEAAIDVVADLLHWLSAHGCDPDEALERAQMHFEAEMANLLRR
ncbi:ATP-binding protein [Streptomyces spectabilis]|uniref:ATP-binding protein n=1 Tax=Streptomyces spectabilis TaxID=68270 RepID=UPI0033C534E1